MRSAQRPIECDVRNPDRRWLLVIALVAGCSTAPAGPGIDVPGAMRHVTVLAGEIGARPGDTDASRRAATYLEHELRAMQLDVERLEAGAVDLPAIEVLGRTYRKAHRVTTTDPDLIVRFGPPGKALLVMAHYDTVPGSPGAVDNAAAVAVVLELARVLAAHPPRVPVLLGFTANEEIGLVGAEVLAARYGSTVEFAVALDLIGGTGELSINGASLLIGKAELGWLASAADHAGVVVRAPLAHRLVSRWWPQAERSDHGPFTRRGIRAVHLYNRGQDGDLIDLAYHSPRDVPARVHPTTVDALGRLLVALTATPIPVHAGDGFWLPVATNTVVPRAALVAVEVALALVAVIVLLGLGRPHGGWGLVRGVGTCAVAVGITFVIERLAAGDHPAPWLHAPLRHLVCELGVLVGVLGLLGRLVDRVRPRPGQAPSRARDFRLTFAIAMPLVVGCVLLAVGAAELAWIWLVPAAVTALAQRWRVLDPLVVLVQLLPLVLVLAPGQVREAAWNGFLPTGVPLVAWIAALGGPVVAAMRWGIGHRRSGPLGVFLLSMGYGLAISAGVLGLFSAEPTCRSSDFKQFQLACEGP